MAGLVPAIHVFLLKSLKTWITGTSPVMTQNVIEAYDMHRAA
jgi:hypothetical protein